MRRVVVSAPCSRNFHSIAPSLPFLPCLPISGARPALAFISFSASGRPSPAPWLRPFPGLASISCLAGLSCIYTSTAFLCLAPCGRQRQPGHHLNQSAPPVSHFHQGNEAGDRCKARTNARALPHRKHLPALCYSSQMGKRGSNPSKRCPACDASVRIAEPAIRSRAGSNPRGAHAALLRRMRCFFALSGRQRFEKVLLRSHISELRVAERKMPAGGEGGGR